MEDKSKKERNYKFSEETRRKMSETRKGRVFTDEHCRHISEGRKEKSKAKRIYVLMASGEWRRFV